MAQFNVRVTDAKRYFLTVDAPDAASAEQKASQIVDQQKVAPYLTVRQTKSAVIDPDAI